MIDEAWRVLARTDEWVRFADAKAAGTLAATGVLSGALLTAAVSESFAHPPLVAVILALACGICSLTSASLALYALVPRLRVGEPTSLIYFEHVGRRYRSDAPGYSAALREMLEDSDRYFTEVSSQIWANSAVARKKHIASGWSIAILGIAIALAGLAALIAIS